ncbi:MAG: hypothetical protein R3D52_13895 [Xanthobacteraceae bacterium]
MELGTFTFKFDHMAELTGKPAEQIVAAHQGPQVATGSGAVP